MKDKEEVKTKEKKSKLGIILKLFYLLISGIISFVFISFSFFGLAGSNPGPIIVMDLCVILSYILIVVSFWKNKAFIGIFLCYVGFVLAALTDSKFWSDHNNRMCEDLRNDPYCSDRGGAWSCGKKSKFGNLTTAGTICDGMGK